MDKIRRRIAKNRCIDCNTPLGPHNRDKEYIRRCRDCIRIVQEYRESGGERRGRPRSIKKET